MQKRLVTSVLAVAALFAFALMASPAGAQDTTAVYVVHGLNLADQTAQDDGGTPVTVCADGETLIADFQFGQVQGPVDLPSGEPVAIEVYNTAEVDCADPGGATLLIDTDVTPEGAAVALTASSVDGELGLSAVALDTECTDEGVGRLTAVHASGDTGEVDVLVDDESVGQLDFGESLDADLPAETYSVQVNLGETPVVGPADIPVAAQTNQLVFVVGNIAGAEPTPVVPLLGSFTVDTCEETTTTTSTPEDTTTSTVPATSPGGVDNAGVGSAGAAPLSITG